MNKLRCEDCGTAFYSAAAKSFAERGERCAVCGGVLRLDDPPAAERDVSIVGQRQRWRRGVPGGGDAA